MTKNSQIDSCDLRILSELTDDAKLPYTEVADRVFVSGGTVHVRMKKMQDLGIVKGASLTIDYAKLGYDVTAFLGIYLERSSMYDECVEQLSKIPEILSLHYTTGAYSIFAKIICRDTKHLREVLHDKIQKVPAIVRTETFISLEERIERAPLLKQLAEESKNDESEKNT